mmetsp:Transcript_17208/g.43765  ORF Transcript_17208/g.43765 Transcript_17208/m.43765 type:complete len:298 (+) Transcript_17208:256-1149(+)
MTGVRPNCRQTLFLVPLKETHQDVQQQAVMALPAKPPREHRVHQPPPRGRRHQLGDPAVLLLRQAEKHAVTLELLGQVLNHLTEREPSGVAAPHQLILVKSSGVSVVLAASFGGPLWDLRSKDIGHRSRLNLLPPQVITIHRLRQPHAPRLMPHQLRHGEVLLAMLAELRPDLRHPLRVPHPALVGEHCHADAGHALAGGEDVLEAIRGIPGGRGVGNAAGEVHNARAAVVHHALGPEVHAGVQTGPEDLPNQLKSWGHSVRFHPNVLSRESEQHSGHGVHHTAAQLGHNPCTRRHS